MYRIDGQEPRVIAKALINDATVFSIASIDSGRRFVIGLRNGTMQPALFAVQVDIANRDESKRILLETEVLLGEAYPTAPAVRGAATKNQVANAVTCVAVVQPVPYTNRHPGVVVGCADGRVFFVKGLESSQGRIETLSVGRLSASVWSVAARYVAPPKLNGDAAEKVADDETLRVYSGGSDGHVMAWERAREIEEGKQGPFAVAWATQERDAIVRLIFSLAPLQQNATSNASLLAVSRSGMVVMLEDEPRISLRVHDQHSLRRPRVPGQRLERATLRDSAFAARPFPGTGGSHLEGNPEPIARLLVVTGTNTIRLLGLHQPKRSSLRQTAYADLTTIWTKFLELPGGDTTDNAPSSSEHSEVTEKAHTRPRPIGALNLRQPEALRSTAPDLWMLPVSMLLSLDPRIREKAPTDPIAYPWVLRSYVETAKRVLLLEENRNFTSEDRAQLLTHLKLSMGAAFDHKSKDLFKEIIEAVLKRFSLMLKGTVRDVEFYNLYIEVLDQIARECRRWLEVDTDAYAKVQICRVKNMVDGDVFLHLTKLAKTEPPLILLPAVERRVFHVGQLLMDGNPLVPLETLRAVNLSLTRAWRLAVEEASHEPIDLWIGVSPLLSSLGAFASLTAGSAQDAVLHEIARAYALAFLAAPTHAVDVALSLLAARVPNSIVDEVRRQIGLLEFWLDIKSKVDAKKMLSLRETFDKTLDRESWGDWEHPVIPKCDSPINVDAPPTIVRWLSRQTDVLLRTPELSTLGSIPRLRPPRDNRNHYRFWRIQIWLLRCKERRYPALGSATLDALTSATGEPPTIRPVLVLASVDLKAWADAARADLEKRYEKRELHDPHYTVYRRVLEEFSGAAGGLRTSVAVQSALVRGVLGHHMIEDLDEQVFNLLELAHVLQPTFDGRKRFPDSKSADGPPQGTVDRFADALVQCATQAESAPKNLRTLLHLMGAVGTITNPASGVDDNANHENLENNDPPAETLVENAFELEIKLLRKASGSNPWPNRPTATNAALVMILGELASNHRLHGLSQHELDITYSVQPGKITIASPYREEFDRTARLIERSKIGAQTFMKKGKTPGSQGTGVYLAQLAAAIEGLELKILRPTVDEKKVSWARFEICQKPLSS